MNDSTEPVVRTWDGEPVSPDPPFGAMIVVYRCGDHQPTFLILHRGQFGPDFDGDWAWGPPSGARYPGEEIDVCAARELREETGFELALTRVSSNEVDWFVYVAEAGSDAEPEMSKEHDRFVWLSCDEAANLITPEFVRAEFTTAASQLLRRTRSNRHE